MKKLLAALAVFILAVPAFAEDTYVNGYYRSNGTYVQGHYRSKPDGNSYNNYSTKGNYNPYTGEAGTKSPYSSNSYGSSYGTGLNYGGLNSNSSNSIWGD